LATVIGLDLSPYMLLVADYKARSEGLAIEWHHGLAENTNLQSDSFDLVTVSMVFHEMPPEISCLVLQEGLRLLRPSGQLLVLDGNQQRLRYADWLIQLFREPYSKVYAAASINDWMRKAGFVSVRTRPIGWIHQITQGQKKAIT
jgi:ubiquinone/menaquinone biosynthesis C-methylase UbiE